MLCRSPRIGLLAAVVFGCAGSPADPDTSAESGGDSTSTATSGSSTGDAEDTAEDEDGGFLPKSDLLAADVGPADSHAEDMQPIWTAGCVIYCHAVGLEPPSGDLDLFEGAYENLVNQPSGQVPAMMLVAPGEPEQSYLWHKLNGTHLDVGGEGDSMPAFGAALDAATLARVEAWILVGAPP